MKIKILIFISLFYFFSCSPSVEKVTIPSDLISRDTLINLIFEVHLADAYLQSNRLPQSNVNKESFYNNIFDQYGLTREKFDSTIFFLTKHPAYYIEIYDDVLDKFSLWEADIDKELSNEKELSDSLKQKRKDEHFQTVKVNSLNDTIESEVIHDSIFMGRVDQAKKRFEERRARKAIIKDSLSIKN